MVSEAQVNPDARIGRANVDRRTVNKALIWGPLGALGVAGVGSILVVRGGERGTVVEEGGAGTDKEDAVDPNDHSVSSAEVTAIVDDLDTTLETVYAETYEERPWANPYKNEGLSREGLIADVTIENPDRLTDEQLTIKIGHTLDRIANVGREPFSVQRARNPENPQDRSYPVGERDSNGNIFGTYKEFVGEELMDPMLNEGLFQLKYNDPEIDRKVEDLKGHFLHFVDDFETAITDPAWLNGATLIVDATLADEPRKSFPGRNLTLAVTTRRPGVKGLPDRVHSGFLDINIDEGPDGEQLIGLCGAVLEDQTER